MDVRFIIAVDIEDVSSLKAAYKELREKLDDDSLSWETTDEFFINGNQGNPESLSNTRKSYFRKLMGME